MRDYMLVYSSEYFVPIGYIDSDFQGDKETQRYTSSYVFTLGSGARSLKSVKQSCTADFTM